MMRTGLIVEVPAAEHAVGPWRRLLDRQAARGVPAHVTVLFPFATAEHVDPDTTAALRRVLAGVAPFEFALTRTAWFERAVLWLAPEPAAPFRTLTEILVEAFPDYPPYGGQFAEVVPHLTIGDHGGETQLAAAEREVRGHLPIAAGAEAVTLMVERPDGQWRRSVTFALGRRPPDDPRAAPR